MKRDAVPEYPGHTLRYGAYVQRAGLWMKPVGGMGVVTVAFALSSCALLGDLDEGAGAFPSAGPMPPVGTPCGRRPMALRVCD